MATTSLPDGLLSPRFCPFLIRTSIDVKQLTFAACAFHLKHHKSSNPTRSLHRPRAGGALAQEPSRTSCEVLPSATGSYLSFFRSPKLPRPAFRSDQDHWRRPNFNVAFFSPIPLHSIVCHNISISGLGWIYPLRSMFSGCL